VAHWVARGGKHGQGVGKSLPGAAAAAAAAEVENLRACVCRMIDTGNRHK